jgi:hypothetical protein
MPAVKLCAATILGAFEEAQTELVGKAMAATSTERATRCDRRFALRHVPR